MLITSFLEGCFFENKSKDLIITSNMTLTYDECDKLSDFFATEIDRQNSKSKLVAILMEKGWEQVIAVFSILKSGKAYLPISLSDSTERIMELLNVGLVEVVLSQGNSKKLLSSEISEIPVNMSHYLSCQKLTSQRKKRHLEEDELAYVIFTSGSTGLPKGVMINHEAVLNTLLDINDRFNVTSKDRIILLSALNFDLSVYDILGSVLAGASIVIPDADKANEPQYLASIIKDKKVTIWNSVPILMQILVEYIEITEEFNQNFIDFSSLRLVLLSGDWIPVSLPDRIRKIFKNAKIISLGGATEASIWSILYEIKEVSPQWSSIPYGKPLKNQSFYILDKNLNKVNDGDRGELYIGGKGLSVGYWQDEKNTALNFIQHKILGRLYKTGDLGRYMSDGNIEFMGRMDSQIKINGYRVEIGAIEACLLSHEYIDQAIVVGVKKGNAYKSMIGYIRSNMEYSNNKKWFQIKNNLSNSILKNWQEIYNAILHTCEVNTFNTSGWINSYTQQEFLKEEMEEWINVTTKNILDLNPRKVLDVGCGTGLIFFKIIDKIDEYHGCDFSATELNYLKKCVKTFNISKSTFFYQMDAHEIPNINHQYDTVILNSITQYFPHLTYMIDVINAVISITQSGGSIYIGDVRNYENIKCYYLSKVLKKLSGTALCDNINYNLYSLSLNEKELLINPSLFFECFASHPKVSHIEIRIKPGKYDNEMNNFRYDVIMRIENNENTVIPEAQYCLDWTKENMNRAKLGKELLIQQKKYIFLKDIPNRRIMWIENILNYCEKQKTNELSFAKINECYGNMLNTAVDQYELYQIAEEAGYDLILTPNDDYGMKQFNALFYRKDLFKNNPLFLLNKNQYKKIENILLSNNPVKNIFISRLIIETKNMMKKTLPDYMIPDKLIYLDKFPLNKNGKVDRKNLPYFISEDAINYKKSKNVYLNEIINLISKVLNNEQITVDNSFREIGGTSLDAVHVVADIYNKFSVSLEINYVLNPKITLKDIADFVSNKIDKKFLHIE